MINPALRLQPGQQKLTRAQEAEAKRFAEEYIRRQLSTEPVDEQEAEALVRQAYQMAKLEPPHRILWVDGPLQLVAALAPPSEWACVKDRVTALAWDRAGVNVGDLVRDRVGDLVRDRLWASVNDSVWASVEASVRATLGDRVDSRVQACVWASVCAYNEAPLDAFFSFFDVYLAPNDSHTLARFNALVSGYWFGPNTVVLVRRPRVLVRDGAGRLHCATGKCIEYQDGWGFWAWHGVRVPEKVILDPDGLTREDFLKKPNVEVRRVIQERMGQRFVSELGGMVIDSGPRGTLYEVALPEVDPYDDSNTDPERVAHYVQVQDASSARQYVLRVPPTIQTAAEAVAWSFGLSVEAYGPAQET